jgi:hypothetical protein
MDNAVIKKRFETLSPHLDERLRRLLVAAEAVAIGRGGITTVLLFFWTTIFLRHSATRRHKAGKAIKL